MNHLLNKISYHPLETWLKLFINKKNIFNHLNNYNNMIKKIKFSLNIDEEWKYFPLKELLSYSFSLSNFQKIKKKDVNNLSLPIDSYRLVFVNGYFISLLSDHDIYPWILTVEKKNNNQSIQLPIQSDFFLYLTEYLSQEIVKIRLPANKKSKKPIYLIHINKENKERNMTNYRHHFDLEVNSFGTIIEHFVSMSNQLYFTGTRTTISVEKNAYLNKIKLCQENSSSFHFSHNDFKVYKKSNVISNTFIFKTKLTRNQNSIQLNGKKSSFLINSLIIPSGTSIIENRTYLEHNEKNCLSKQIHKIIAKDYGIGNFNGLIKIKKNSFETNANMINNNLLLNKSSMINTTPKLEIHENNVKCKHGSTIGYVDQEQIFYFRSRGVNEKDAKNMIVNAFSLEIIKRINQKPIQEFISSYIKKIIKKN